MGNNCKSICFAADEGSRSMADIENIGQKKLEASYHSKKNQEKNKFSNILSDSKNITVDENGLFTFSLDNGATY